MVNMNKYNELSEQLEELVNEANKIVKEIYDMRLELQQICPHVHIKQIKMYNAIGSNRFYKLCVDCKAEIR